MRALPFSQPGSVLPTAQPWLRQPCGQLVAPPSPCLRLPRLAALWPRCTTLRLSSSVYSFQIHTRCLLFGSLFCVMVFGLFFHPSQPPRQIPKKTSFWSQL